MELRFFKYHGAGNDFVILDGRESDVQLSTEQVEHLCSRRFGIGADGLMMLQSSDAYDFRMRYYNADGAESTMCGNGGRCMVAFANHLGLIDRTTVFEAVDGEHAAEVMEYGVETVVRLKMNDVDQVELDPERIFLDTGSPHHVTLVLSADEVDIEKEGRHWRHHEEYKAIGGTNVNFVEQEGVDQLYVRTFERGVEAETYSCGTGVTAAALAMHRLEKLEGQQVHVRTRGGELQVDFESQGSSYANVFLTGPATFVYQGIIDID